MIKGILLDIEGTTSDIRFVYDVLMPYAAARMASFAGAHWDDEGVVAARALAREESSNAALADDRERVVAYWLDLASRDVKATSLKAIQGLIWKEGYAAGDLKSHVYDDVPPAIRSWNDAGLDVRIYSSGSVTAQKSFFANTAAGDLLPLFRGHYDTTVGGKKETASYTAIAADMQLPAERILFISDVTAELQAARTTGVQCRLCVRGETPEDAGDFLVIRSFDEVTIT